MQAFEFLAPVRAAGRVRRQSARMRLRALSAAAALAVAALPQLASAANCSFSSGLYSGSGCATTLGADDSVSLLPGNYKYLDLTLNAQAGSAIDAFDHFYFRPGNTLNNAGNFRFNNDSGLYNDAATGVFVNTGTLAKIGGGGDSYVSISGFTSNGGTVNVQTGRVVFNAGATFNAGSGFTGPGQTLITSGATLSGNFSSDGSLVLAGGSYTGSGPSANFANGTVQWTAGALAGNWQTATGTTLNLSAGSYKYISGTVTNGGTLAATDHLYFTGGQTLVNNGSYQFAGDAGLYNNDSGPGNFVNNGTLSKTGGGGDSHVSISGFSNGATGVVNVQAGRIVFDNGATFASGSSFTGAGQALVTNGATFSGALSTANNLYLSGGTFTANNVVATGDVSWTAGTLAGTWQTAAGSTLDLDAGSYKYVTGTLTNAGTMTATDHLYVNPNSSLVNNGLYRFANDAGLYDNNGGPGSFVNNGTLAKVGGGGDSHVSLSGFSNGAGGVIDVQSGRIVFDNGATFASGSSFTGAGQALVTNGATFSGALSTANNLYLSGGTFTANNVVATGDVSWTAGTLAGTWQTAAGSTLHLDAGSYKYVTGTLTNAGTMTATDHLYVNPGSSLVNNGLYRFANDAGLYDNNGGPGSFINNGTLAKVGGGGDSHVSLSGFSNAGTGVIDVLSGRMVFDNGAVLNGGSKVTGAGQVLVTNGAAINGALSTAGNLYLAGGTVMAGNVVASGGVHFTSGVMAGQWQTATGSTLYVEAGSYKYWSGLTLSGRTVATDHFYGASGTLTNNGRYEFANDAGIYSGTVVNNGLIVKAGGGGTSDLSSLALQSAGTLEAQAGTLRLPDNFANAGTLMGVATIQVNGTLANNGHIAPGSSTATGTLTLAGNLSQGAGGTLDIRLTSASMSDMLQVNGTADIGGSMLALSCFACALHNGDAFLLMSSTGALTGLFAGVSTSGFGNGFQYALDYSHANQVWLDVTQVGAVPEPSTYAMLLAGVSVIGWLARRRRALA